MKQRIFCVILLCYVLLVATPTAWGQSAAGAFGETWKLLEKEQKLHFVSGYLHGLRDAQRINDIATEYIRSNPKQAGEALEKLRPLYDLATVVPERVVGELDRFYGNPDQSGAPLSIAMSAARNSLLGQ